MRINFLVILGLIFFVAGAALVATNLDNLPSGEIHSAQRVGGGTVYYMPGGGGLITGGTFLFVGFVLAGVGLAMGRSAQAAAQLLATGVPGQATITAMRQTGVFVNHNPQVALSLMVSVQGQQPYAVQHNTVVPMMLLGRLSNGHPLNVRVDPTQPMRLVIDWARG